MASKGFIELLRLADMAASRRKARLSLDHDQWLGIGFEMSGWRFVAPIGEVAEVLALPDSITPVPFVQPWFIGITNLRGRLLPITDLVNFLTTGQDVPQSSLHSRDCKILVVDQPNLFVGLLVDKVFGIQQFDNSDYVKDVNTIIKPIMQATDSTQIHSAALTVNEKNAEQDVTQAVGVDLSSHSVIEEMQQQLFEPSLFLPYCQGKFMQGEKGWMIFLLSRLTQDTRFLEAAV